jgi:hypothetical protein
VSTDHPRQNVEPSRRGDCAPNGASACLPTGLNECVTTVLVREEKHPRFDQRRREEQSGADTDLPIGATAFCAAVWRAVGARFGQYAPVRPRVLLVVGVGLLSLAGCTDDDSMAAPTTTSTVTASTGTSTSAAPTCVARGEAATAVPNVLGETLSNAIAIVQGAGLNVVDGGVPEGDPMGQGARGIAQEPSAGEQVPLGACVGFRTEG